jgi:surface protein
MEAEITRKGDEKASKDREALQSKAGPDTEAIAMADADAYANTENGSIINNHLGRINVKICTESTNGASGAYLSSATVTAKTSAGARGKDASPSGVQGDMKSTKSCREKYYAAAEETVSIAMEVFGEVDGYGVGKIGGGTGAMRVNDLGSSSGSLGAEQAPYMASPHGLDTIPAAAGTVGAKATYKSVISGMARANQSNVITEENYYLLQWLYRIRRVSYARGLRIGFLQPDFLWVIYRPMMRSKKLWRTDGDIKVAVNLWCSNRAAAEERYGHISEWDVSSVTDMSQLFASKTYFNDDISRWDVSEVTNMWGMFWVAHAFNEAVGDWDVSSVTSMRAMFWGAQSFNQPVGDWDASNVTNMECMFNGARAFNQPVGDWDVSNVTNMECMFNGALSFNQPVGDWDVSNMIYMAHMFSGALSFNQPVGDWDVSKVTYMHCILSNAQSFNQDLTRWDMRSVRYAGGMFDDAHAMQSDNKPASFR